MYLRLKPRYVALPHASGRKCRTLAQDIHDLLHERNLNSFDWIHGGQAGPIKFVDLHQFEFAVDRARTGDFVATLMVNLYLDGIGQLIVPDHGGACQYSTGVSWNSRNQKITLAGQAVVLQALALGTRLYQRTRELNLGTQINRFVRANRREIGLWRLGDGVANPRVATDPQIRDNAWYAAALHQFAHAYRITELIHEAARLFEATVRIHENSDPPRQGPESASELSRIVAVAAVQTYFGAATARLDLLDNARSMICETVPRHAHHNGGYVQGGSVDIDPDIGIDIDCTIDLARTCLVLLRLVPNRRLWTIARHCLAALFDPAIALARRPETGILLVATALAEVSLARVPDIERA